MFWLYFLIGCVVVLILLALGILIVMRVRNKSIKSDLDIAY